MVWAAADMRARLFVILVVGLNLASLLLWGAAAYATYLAHYRVQHIETSLGIDSEYPNGRVRASFKVLVDMLRHMHEEELKPIYRALEPVMEHPDETFRPLIEEKSTVETRLKTAGD